MRHPAFHVLDQYAPQDPLERRHLSQTLDWLATSPAPLDRRNFEPGHATGSGLIISPGKKVALVYHRTLKRWLQPGGHVDPADVDLQSTAVREIREELGLNVSGCLAKFRDLDVHEIPAGPKGPRHLHFDFRFVFVLEEQDLKPADDVEKAGWFDGPEALRIAADSGGEGLSRLIKKALADSD